MSLSDFDEQLLKLHYRMVNEDPTAFAELCELILEQLFDKLQRDYPNLAADIISDVATDLLLNYQRNPHQYNPEKLPLFNYLRMAGRGDIKNAIDKIQREAKKIVPISNEDVELFSEDRNNRQDSLELDEWLSKLTNYSKEEIFSLVQEEFENSKDIEIIYLMIEGVRATEHYARVLEIQDLPEDIKKKKVKQTKDRIKKKLTRLGKRIDKHE